MTELEILKEQVKQTQEAFAKYKADTEVILKETTENRAALQTATESLNKLQSENNIYREFLNKGIIKTETTEAKQEESLIDFLYKEGE